jgi:glycosyltransferase involved in cell wall biosynthesis
MVSYSVYDGDGRVRRYAEALVKQGYQVDSFAMWGVGHQSLGEVVNGVRVFRIQGRIKNEKTKFTYLWRLVSFFLRSSWYLAREHRRRPYDLIHVHSVPDFEVFAALYPKLTGAKVILDIHDMVPEFYSSKFNVSESSLVYKSLIGIEKASTAFADHVIASNHLWEERLRTRAVARKKVTAIINYPDTEVFKRQGKSRNDGKFIVLYPGSLTYHQGLDIAIRAFSRIHNHIPNAEFHIYGSGDQLIKLKALTAELGLEEKVRFKGSVVVETMVRVIEDADLGVVPKRGDGFGGEAFSTKILEFMAMGVPVIIPNTTIDTYYFNDSVARFFQAGDEASLAEAMFTVIRDPRLRENMVRNASQFVAHYTWEAHKSTYLGVVNALLKPARLQKAEAPASLLPEK